MEFDRRYQVLRILDVLSNAGSDTSSLTISCLSGYFARFNFVSTVMGFLDIE